MKAGTVEQVRALIARAMLADDVDDPVLGRITLDVHQNAALGRLRRSLAEFGGALLADDVGLGKTYVALALARRFARPVVVAPAALRVMWLQAIHDTHSAIPVLSLESLGQRGHRGDPPDFVIIDEAHHARNPATRRYRALATLTSGARTLLVTATPIHNSPRDLHAILALFLGARAATLSADEQARCIVRRDHSALGGVRRVPTAAALRWLDVVGDDAVLDAILAIPPPAATRDGAIAAALVQVGLIRAWCSSEAALRSVLRRRLGSGAALTQALQSGRHPSRRELAAWTLSDDAVQLAFPEFLVAPHEPRDHAVLLQAISAHVQGIRRALSALGDSIERGGADRARIEHLRAIRLSHPGARVLAFTQFAETARAMYSGIERDGRVALLTASGGRIASGSLARTDVLAAFDPAATPGRASSATSADFIACLIATDVISEGVNLQSASVVVHLDLPWTGARLAQRLGRVRRLGSPHQLVHAYAFAPPSHGERLLRLIERIRVKLSAAHSLVGAEGTLAQELEVAASLIGDGGASRVPRAMRLSHSAPSSAESIRALLCSWRDRSPYGEGNTGPPLYAVVRQAAAASPHVIALLVADAGALLLCDDGAGLLTADPHRLLTALRLANGEPATPSDADVRGATEMVEGWIAAQSARQMVAAATDSPSVAHRQALRRIATLGSGVPRHLRDPWNVAIGEARCAILASRGAGAEIALAEWVAEGRGIEAASGEALRWLKRGPSAPNQDARGEPAAYTLRALLFIADA